MAKKNDGYVVEDTHPYLKDGKREGTWVFLRNESTQECKARLYLNPYGKGKKYAAELKDHLHYTCTGQMQRGEDGKVLPWTSNDRSYRCGYLDALRDVSAARKAKKNRPPKES